MKSMFERISDVIDGDLRERYPDDAFARYCALMVLLCEILARNRITVARARQLVADVVEDPRFAQGLAHAKMLNAARAGGGRGRGGLLD